jgi:hypothetical protein
MGPRRAAQHGSARERRVDDVLRPSRQPAGRHVLPTTCMFASFACRRAAHAPLRAAFSPRLAHGRVARPPPFSSCPRSIAARAFRHLASPPAETPPAASNASKSPPPKPQPTQPASPSKPAASLDAKDYTPAEQRRRDWVIIRRLARNVWPANDWGVKGRIVLGLGLLLGGKVCPFLSFSTLTF